MWFLVNFDGRTGSSPPNGFSEAIMSGKFIVKSNVYGTAASGFWEASAEMFEKALEQRCRRSARDEMQAHVSAVTRRAKGRVD
jgi:hypothetical protein